MRGGTIVGEIMSRNVHTIAADAELWQARAELSHRAIHHLFVEDHGRVVAIISDRDVLQHISPFADTIASQTRDEATLHRKVFQVASFHLVTIAQTALVEEAAAVLLDRGISCVAVVDEEDRIVGVVTTRDLLRATLACVVPIQR